MATRKKTDISFTPSIRETLNKRETDINREIVNDRPLVKIKPEFRNTQTYSVKLKDPRWQRKRLNIMNRDDFTCRICGDKETTLAIHHLKYSGEPWDAPDDKLITVCEDCHETIEEHKSDIKDFGSFKIIKRRILYNDIESSEKVQFISYDNIINLKIVCGNNIIVKFNIEGKPLIDIAKLFSIHLVE